MYYYSIINIKLIGNDDYYWKYSIRYIFIDISKLTCVWANLLNNMIWK